jgi:PIN domain nuclease of toxin-antitoxin system
MVRAVADTHTLVWYLYGDPRLSNVGRAAIDAAAARGEQVGLSSITLAEIVYLVERERIAAKTFDRVLAEMDSEDAVLVEIPFDRTVARAMQDASCLCVREMPDRIVAATAWSLGVPLISRDRAIQASGVQTIW